MTRAGQIESDTLRIVRTITSAVDSRRIRRELHMDRETMGMERQSNVIKNPSRRHMSISATIRTNDDKMMTNVASLSNDLTTMDDDVTEARRMRIEGHGGEWQQALTTVIALEMVMQNNLGGSWAQDLARRRRRMRRAVAKDRGFSRARMETRDIVSAKSSVLHASHSMPGT